MIDHLMSALSKLATGRRCLLRVSIGLVLTAYALSGESAVTDLGSENYGQQLQLVAFFIDDLPDAIDRVIGHAEYDAFVTQLWLFFSFIIISFGLIKYVFGSGDALYDLAFSLMYVIFVRLLIEMYSVITDAFWGWSKDFADVAQMGILNQADPDFPFEFILNLLFKHVFEYPSVTEMLADWENLVVIIILLLITGILTVLTVLASVWVVWGYALAKIVGLMFVPTILFKRLSFLFEGWLRFFFSFLIFQVVLRISMSLIVLGLMRYYNVPADLTQLEGNTWIISGKSWQEYFGLFVFLLIALAGIMSTAKFVSSIVSGASISVGGMGDTFRRNMEKYVR